MGKINPKIFKAYDIRGIYPVEIDEDAVCQIGQAFVEFLSNQGEVGNRRFVVGRDGRLSSPDLAEALIQGLVNSSGDVIDIGQVSTPLFYWTIINEKTDGGIMVTASHNGTLYNGLKLCKYAARSINSENGLLKIRELVLKNRLFTISSSPGKVVQKGLLAAYIDFLKSKADVETIKPLKIIIDCANGTMGPEIIELFKDLSCKVTLLYADSDGSFPNHEPNPMKEESLVKLKKAILSEKADLGAVFDGDGDRVRFIDEKGESVRGDFITAIIAQELLKVEPGEKIFYEVRSSRVLPEIILRAGGEPVLGSAGSALIKEQMRRENILFGGELSGHYFFKNIGFIESPLSVILEILGIIGREQKTLSEIIEPLKKYFLSGEINFSLENPDEILKKVKSHFSDARIKKIDGLTVEYPDWWFNLRKSNTEPLIRLNLEADSSELMEKKKKELIELING